MSDTYAGFGNRGDRSTITQFHVVGYDVIEVRIDPVGVHVAPN